MDEILVCIAIIIAIITFRRHGHQEEAGTYATVHQASDIEEASGVSNSSLFDDDWPASSMQSSSFDTDWWTDPAYAFMAGNIYHNTLMDPTHTDWNETSSTDESCSTCYSESDTNLFDDSLPSMSSLDDTFSSSSFDDSCSSSSFDDSFSSGSSFDD